MVTDAVKTTDLTKTYKDTVAVNKLSVTIPTGELFALLGVNGAGKTTLIKMLSCLTLQSGGDAFIMGKSITGERGEVKKIIGISPQETAVAPMLSVRENLRFICGIHGFSKEKTDKKTKELSELFGFESIEKKKACKLSGGWQRKLSIAMALIGEPQVLFLDEPTIGLDIIARSELWETVKALKGKTTVILTTHYLEEAEELADRIGIMRKGSLITVGTPDEIKKSVGTDSFEKAFISIVKGGETA